MRSGVFGEYPTFSDVVISFSGSNDNMPSVSARFVKEQGGDQHELDIDDATT